MKISSFSTFSCWANSSKVGRIVVIRQFKGWKWNLRNDEKSEFLSNVEAEDTGKRKFMGEIMMSNQELRDSQRVLLLFIKVDRRRKKQEELPWKSIFAKLLYKNLFLLFTLSFSLRGGRFVPFHITWRVLSSWTFIFSTRDFVWLPSSKFIKCSVNQ